MRVSVCTLIAACALPVAAHADVVFQNTTNNGYFTPFSSASNPAIKYGDSGWLSNNGSDTYTLTSITLSLAVAGSTAVGSTDIIFTFNDGDPSGLGFGPGTALYTTTIQNVQLPDASQTAGLAYFTLTIPLPNIHTTGGFNNVGWSVKLANYQSNGQFGFQCSRSTGQAVGFYTNNASFYNGTTWSLFAFGPDPVTGVANFVVTIEGAVTVPPVPCYANCDGSTTTPTLTANDFQCFLNSFASSNSYANCDGSTTTPTLTANDFQCFLNAFAAGCS